MSNEVSMEKVIEILKQNVVGLDKINIEAETPLISSGLVESIDFIEILCVIEREFDVKLQLDMLDFANLENAKLISIMISDAISQKEKVG
ncbi:MAG: acyl carrier protein [Bacillota bacterium]|nr:acyl carrier protein [Bacillota bacterium]